MSKHDHDGHRDRVRKKFLNGGFEGFYEHEVLEMLLFYSVPRRDTNEMAHRLIDRFHGLNNVWDAKMQLLQEVDGVTKNCAVLIKMIPQICRMYVNDEYDREELRFDSKEVVYKFAIDQYIAATSREFKAVLLDRDLNYIGCVDICKVSGANMVMGALRKVVERMQYYSADYVILMHNYLGGSKDYSEADDHVVCSVSMVLRSIGVALLDYIVVCDDACKSIYHA